MDLGLKGPDGVSVFFTKVFFNVFSEDDNRIVILFHATLGTLDTRLEPGHDAFLVKNMLALEFLRLGSTDLLKTHGTCFGKMCKALPVLDRLLFALGSRLSH